MTIEQLAATSAAVAGTRSRLKKIELLSDFLSQASTTELPIAVKFLAGELPQGKIGLGYAAVHKALEAAEHLPNAGAADQPMSLVKANDIFTSIANVSGKGAHARRHELLLDGCPQK